MSSVSVWIKDGKTPKPKGDTHYILARNGIFIYKEMQFWRATVPVDRISILEEEERPYIELLLPRMPAEAVRATTRFFAWVYDRYDAEAVVLLWFRPETGEYRVSAPLQRVSKGRLPYYEIPDRIRGEVLIETLPYCEISDRVRGEVLIGTFHSHGSIDAFHSSIDQCDERSLDGVHAAFGKFSRGREKDRFNVSFQVVVNGYRQSVDPLMWLEGIKEWVEPEPVALSDDGAEPEQEPEKNTAEEESAEPARDAASEEMPAALTENKETQEEDAQKQTLAPEHGIGKKIFNAAKHFISRGSNDFPSDMYSPPPHGYAHLPREYAPPPQMQRSFYHPMSAPRFVLDDEEGILLPKDYSPPKEWMDNVKPQGWARIFQPSQEKKQEGVSPRTEQVRTIAANPEEFEIVEEKGKIVFRPKGNKSAKKSDTGEVKKENGA